MKLENMFYHGFPQPNKPKVGERGRFLGEEKMIKKVRTLSEILTQKSWENSLEAQTGHPQTSKESFATIFNS